jgi:predicted RNA-binding Zn-ribbon protein involved in translation (DUF1610 family)
MQALGAADVLHVWEVGRRQVAAERALTLLARACPERGRDELLGLPLGDRDRLLLEARAAALGPTLEATASCPACGEVVELRLEIETLLAGGGVAADDEATLTAGEHELRFRRLDSADLLAAASCRDSEAARALLVERCVVAARRDGRDVAPRDLPPAAVAAVAERLAAVDAQVETLLDLTCPACGDAWRTELDPATFVWEELRARALALLDDVDVLARAYGWSEGEILALGAERRRLYVERALA